MQGRFTDIKDLQDAKYEYQPETWFDKVIDPEGHNSRPGKKWNAKRGNNIEAGIDKAHERLDLHVDFLEGTELTNKQMRFRMLLLEAAVAQGTAGNMMVDNFEDTTSINLIAGAHDVERLRIYLP